MVQSQAGSYTVETVPNPKQGGTGYVSDPNGFLSIEEIAQINQMIAELEGMATAQIAVVVLNSIGVENPKDFATRLFEHWGIGQADTDNGLLILNVMDQRRTEFETGYGLEAVLPDAICYRVGMQELVPYFKENQYGQGLIAVVRKFKEILEQPEVVEEIRSERTTRKKGWIGLPPLLEWYLIVNIFIHIALITWIILTLSSKADLYDKYRNIRKIFSFVLIILFPLPYLGLYFFLKKLLEKLRYHPRYSKQNGQMMSRLEEEDEDIFLQKGQVTEEEIGSVDYDVWISEDGEDILILRYAKRFSKYTSCPKCKYKTFYLSRTEIISYATYSSSGKKRIIHDCKNCEYTKVTYQVIPKKTSSSSGSGSSGGSSGGSSWGGGSSGGGGAGVSW